MYSFEFTGQERSERSRSSLDGVMRPDLGLWCGICASYYTGWHYGRCSEDIHHVIFCRFPLFTYLQVSSEVLLIESFDGWTTQGTTILSHYRRALVHPFGFFQMRGGFLQGQ
ncbi:hypothetical protein ACET3Z_024588 [Daucus carota]